MDGILLSLHGSTLFFTPGLPDWLTGLFMYLISGQKSELIQSYGTAFRVSSFFFFIRAGFLDLLFLLCVYQKHTRTLLSHLLFLFLLLSIFL